MSKSSDGGARPTAQDKRALLAEILRKKIGRSVCEYPLSQGQQALWFLYLSAPDSAAYNAAQAMRIRSAVDVSALRSVFQQLVARHPVLRTTYRSGRTAPVQIVHASQELEFTQIDASGWDCDELTQRVSEDYARPFDLVSGPVFRVTLFTQGPDDHVLLLNIHHIACDAWSIWLLMNEFRQLYPATIAGRTVDLPPLEHTYADYIRWQDAMLSGPEGEQLWEYWSDRLSGEPPSIGLPSDRPRPPVQTWRGASHPFRIPRDLTKRLQELSTSQGATPFMALLAAFQTLLHRYTGQDDILVGSPTTGRSQTDFTGVVGYFVNPVVLRGDLSEAPSFREVLSRARHTVLDALTHQDCPFPYIVERLQPKRDPSRSPLFQVQFVYQRPPRSDEFADFLVPGRNNGRVKCGGLELEAFDLPQMEGQFDLTLELREAGDSLSGVLKYNADLFDASTVERMEEHFRSLLTGIAANPDLCISELPLLTEAERRRTLVEWNDTHSEYRLDCCLHELIEEQVRLTPEALAVTVPTRSGPSQDGRELTYRQLDERANRLAHYLRRQGVGSFLSSNTSAIVS